MTSWPAWAAMAGGHNRRGSTEGVGHARRSWNAVRDDYPRPSLAESAARALPFPKSQRPTCPFSFAPGGTPPAPYGPPRHPPLPGVILFWRIRCYLGRPAGHLRCALSLKPPPTLTEPRPGDLWPGRDCCGEFRQARSRTPPPDSVLAVVGITDGVRQGGSVMSTLRRGPCWASRHYRGRRNSPCAPPCACCRRRPVRGTSANAWNIAVGAANGVGIANLRACPPPDRSRGRGPSLLGRGRSE